MICSFCRSGRKVLSPITMSFVDYYRAAAVRRAGVADATARKELGYGGSFSFTKALEQCGRLSRPALEGSLEILADADARMKQSAADGRTVLEVTILQLIELLRRNGHEAAVEVSSYRGGKIR